MIAAVRRMAAGITALSIATLLLAVGATAAGAAPTKYCSGPVSASKYKVTLVASRIHVVSTTYGHGQAHEIWPAMSCARVRDVAVAYLSAKLNRPLNQCTVPAIKGYWCHVDHWLCAAANPLSRSPTPEQECAHVVIGPGGSLRRYTRIYFRETDHDNA